MATVEVVGCPGSDLKSFVRNGSSSPVKVIGGPTSSGPVRFLASDHETKVMRHETEVDATIRVGCCEPVRCSSVFWETCPGGGVGGAVQGMRMLGQQRRFIGVWGRAPMEREVPVTFTREGRSAGQSRSTSLYSAVSHVLRACEFVLDRSHLNLSWVEQFGRVALEGVISGFAVVAHLWRRTGASVEVRGSVRIGGSCIPPAWKTIAATGSQIAVDDSLEERGRLFW